MDMIYYWIIFNMLEIIKYLYYVFKYVGVITIGSTVVKVIPKYIISDDEPLYEMKQILRVLEKYNNSTEQIVDFYNGEDEEKSFNILPLVLYLLNDYHEYGVYSKKEDTYEINGDQEILYERTMDNYFPIIVDDRPYYTELVTRKKENMRMILSIESIRLY